MNKKAAFLDFISSINLGNFFKAIFCSALNLLILAIIYLFISKFSQGFVIPIDLYMKTDPASFVVNIVMFHFLLSFLALIMTLYPTYIFAFFFEDETKKFYTSTRLGLIYYDYHEKNTANEPPSPLWTPAHALRATESYIRKITGLSLFIIWTWVIIYVYNKHQITLGNTYALNSIGIGSTLLLLILFVHLNRIKNKRQQAKLDWWQNIGEKSYKWYIPFFILMNAILCVVAWKFEWNFLTVLIQLLICFLLGAHLIILRSFRTKIKWVKEIYNYLDIHRFLGIITIVFIILFNAKTHIAEGINPINMILAYLIAIYTIITMLFKWYLFLKNEDKNNNENYIPLGFGKLYLRGYRIFIIAFIAYFIWNAKQTNTLHQLSLVDKQEKYESKSLKDFCIDFQNGRQLDERPIFYAAYGGGLKAHYWNFQILEALSDSSQFRNIVAMSGVSGGGMGIGNFTAAKYLNKTKQERTTLIKKVKSSNILGIELSWFMGYDYLRAMLPFKKGLGKGRSFRSTKYYTNLLGAQELTDQLSFEKVYHQLSHNKHYPNIIFNSTAAANKYGVVSGINDQGMFPASINLLDIEDKTLSYFEAITTCNRFPVISPAADIPTKGYFLDGGYFENSGIMSLTSFANAIHELEKDLPKDTSGSAYIPFMDKQLNLITVSNTKLNYLQFILNKAGLDYAQISNKEMIKTDSITEIKAIISGAIELDRMPSYIRSMVEEYQSEKFKIIDISLPYYFQIDQIEQSKEDDINKLFGGTLYPKKREELVKIINKSNTEIITTLENHHDKYDIESWGIIDPPTARILSKPVEIYMDAMMQHPYVRQQLSLIGN